MTSASDTADRDDAHRRIVVAAASLLATGGRDAVTTRAVALAAGVQPPAIYRLFGDKDGLLDAVAEHGYAAYLAEKRVREPGPDPVEDLRAGWDLHVGFGLANPGIYALLYGDPRPGHLRPAAAAGHRVLESHVGRVAAAGRLRVPEQVAVDVLHAAACGTVLTLLTQTSDSRDESLSPVAREAAVAAITTDEPAPEAPRPATAAITLRAQLSHVTSLSEPERQLLAEWLDRVASG